MKNSYCHVVFVDVKNDFFLDVMLQIYVTCNKKCAQLWDLTQRTNISIQDPKQDPARMDPALMNRPIIHGNSLVQKQHQHRR